MSCYFSLNFEEGCNNKLKIKKLTTTPNAPDRFSCPFLCQGPSRSFKDMSVYTENYGLLIIQTLYAVYLLPRAEKLIQLHLYSYCDHRKQGDMPCIHKHLDAFLQYYVVK